MRTVDLKITKQFEAKTFIQITVTKLINFGRKKHVRKKHSPILKIELKIYIQSDFHCIDVF